VFDGHQGALTAALAAQHMPQLLHSALLGRALASSAGARRLPDARGGAGGAALSAFEAAVAAAFLSFDRWWRDARCDPALTQHGWDESGATALVRGRACTLFCACDPAFGGVVSGRAKRHHMGKPC
jgi:hypothetical protein